jgi:hypothetical protein
LESKDLKKTIKVLRLDNAREYFYLRRLVSNNILVRSFEFSTTEKRKGEKIVTIPYERILAVFNELEI